MPYLSWQTLVIGDPLCAPFEATRRTAAEIDPGFDADAELPTLFAKARLATLPASVNRNAAVAYIRALSRTDRGDTPGTLEALETAVIADGRFTAARLELALLQERQGQIDRAVANYRAIVEFDRNQAVALNNLAMN